MSLFDRFMKEVLPLQIYGKLPVARDYLRVGTSQGGPRRVRQWMDECFSPKLGGESVPELDGPMRYLLGCYPGDAIVGVVWPSIDQGGTRRFPFTALIERRRRSLVDDWNDGGARTEKDWEALEDVYAVAGKSASGQAFLEKVHGKTLQHPAAGQEALGNVSFEVWMQELWGPEPEARLAKTLGQVLGLGASGHRGPILLPLAGRLRILPQVQAWALALQKAGLLDDDRPPTVFFPSEAADGRRHLQAVFLREAPDEPVARLLSGLVPCGDELPGDLCGSVDRSPRDILPNPERSPPLSSSMLGALASAKIR